MSEKGPEECPVCQSRNACLAFADLGYCPHENDRVATLQLPSPSSMLEEIVGHLGACQIQRAPADDRIIAAHIDAAYALAAALWKAQRDPLEPCRACEGSGEVFVRRNSKGKIDYIDGSPTSETTRCDMCHGEGVRGR